MSASERPWALVLVGMLAFTTFRCVAEGPDSVVFWLIFPLIVGLIVLLAALAADDDE